MNARTLSVGFIVAATSVALHAVQAPSVQPAAQTPVPLLGIAQVTFKSSDLSKSRAYYQDVLGFQEAFTVTDSAGVTSTYFKVNDNQYLEDHTNPEARRTRARGARRLFKLRPRKAALNLCGTRIGSHSHREGTRREPDFSREGPGR